jgi:hypothetical protein
MGTIENATIKLACMWPSWNVHHRQDPSRLNPHAPSSMTRAAQEDMHHAWERFPSLLATTTITPPRSVHTTVLMATTPRGMQKIPHSIYSCYPWLIWSFSCTLLLPALNKENSETLERYQNQKWVLSVSLKCHHVLGCDFLSWSLKSCYSRWLPSPRWHGKGLGDLPRWNYYEEAPKGLHGIENHHARLSNGHSLLDESLTEP